MRSIRIHTLLRFAGALLAFLLVNAEAEESRAAEIGRLIEVLQTSKDAAARFCAASELGHMEAVEAIPALIEALNDPDANVRTFSARAFGSFNIATLRDRAGATLQPSVTLRPHVSKLSPADARKVQLSIGYGTFLLINGQAVATSSTHYVCDENTLRYHIRGPTGDLILERGRDFVPPGRRGLLYHSTYEILDENGIAYGENYWFRWLNSEKPQFDRVGIYRVRLSGSFMDERDPTSRLPFESNEVTYEVSDRFASNAALVARTHAALKEELGIEAPATHRIHEDKDQTKLVIFRVSKADYPEAWLPRGTIGRGQYSGMEFRCRFTAEGQLLEANSRPRFRIICP